MPALQPPTVFVSSTCYDLSEIRDDLKSFIESFGFEPMLSEYNPFPINPLEGTVENCRRNVEQRADMLVLVVGKRYGSTDDTGTSITNIEYMQARAKGIPIYVFIRRSILELLPVWKENPDAKFSSIDSTRLLEFVDSLKNVDRLWIHPFDKAPEIVDTLRTQWACLFHDALELWRKARDAALPDTLRRLTGSALRLVIERPAGWEYHLYSQVLQDRIAGLADLKRDRELGVVLGDHEHVGPERILAWAAAHQDEIGQKLEAVNTLFRQDVIEDSFGAPGEPGTPEKIVYMADRLAALYRETIEWSLRCLRVSTDEEYKGLLALIAKEVDNVISEIEGFSNSLQAEMTDLLSNPPAKDEVRHINLVLELTYPDGLLEEFDQELHRIKSTIVGD